MKLGSLVFFLLIPAAAADTADANTTLCRTCREHEQCVREDKMHWRCEKTAAAPIRLVSNNSSCSGRVEIYHDNQWGTVCDDGWDLRDAEVVCRQLGCGMAAAAHQNAYFGAGTGPIWLDDVGCSGNESSLEQCPHRGFGVHNCGHGEDAGVVCTELLQVRVSNGYDNCSGRVEIYHDNQWGTVCDDGWDLRDAEVVCRQLGCGMAAAAHQNAYFGAGTGPIWLDDVGCSGNESSLEQCPHRGFGVHNCGHGEDAGVVCTGFPSHLAPQLDCGRSLIKVGVYRPSMEAVGLNLSSAHLSNPSCGPHMETNDTVWFQMEHKDGSCGTWLKTNGSHAIYSNSLFIYTFSRRNSSSLPVSFPFSCIFPLDSQASLDVAIEPDLVNTGIQSTGPGAQATMTLYRNANFTEPYSAGLLGLPLGSALYVGVSVEEMDVGRFVLVLEDCYTTPSSSPDDPTRYYLIQNSCPSDSRLVTIVESGESLQARFSALLFMFEENSIYLHCSLTVCDQQESTCAHSCSPRRRRAVSLRHSLTAGPISWVQKDTAGAAP